MRAACLGASPAGLRFVPLGVGDAFSTLYYSSSLAVEAEGQQLLVDCPHPIRKMLREASPPEARSSARIACPAVVLTHLHADHCSGLESLAYYLHFRLGRRLQILAHPLVAARLWDGHLAAAWRRARTMA